MAATEIHYSESNMAFVAAWRRRHHPAQLLRDENGRTAALIPERELLAEPTRFDQRTIDALLAKFIRVDEIFRSIE